MFRAYRHVTKFENGTEYFTYLLVCALSGATLILSQQLGGNINAPRKQVLEGLITALGLIGVRIVIRFFLNYRKKKGQLEKRAVF